MFSGGGAPCARKLEMLSPPSQADAFAFRPEVAASDLIRASAAASAGSSASTASLVAVPLVAAASFSVSAPSALPFFAHLAREAAAPLPSDLEALRLAATIDVRADPGAFVRMCLVVLGPALDFLSGLAWNMAGVVQNPFTIAILSSWPPDLIKNYRRHIRTVMDLPTMRAALDARKYAEAGARTVGPLVAQCTAASQSFLADARLIARNARYFNCPPSFSDAVRSRAAQRPKKGVAEVVVAEDWFPSVSEVQASKALHAQRNEVVGKLEILHVVPTFNTALILSAGAKSC